MKSTASTIVVGKAATVSISGAKGKKSYWKQSTDTKAGATSATIKSYRGAKLKKGTRYYVRIVTRRQRNGVFCTVPLPAKNTSIGSFVVY